MKKRNILRRILAVVLVLTMATGLTAQAKGDASSTSLKEAQKEKAALEKQLKAAKELINDLKDSKGDVEDKVQELNNELVDISSKITSLENQLADKSTEIADAEAELAQAEADKQKQYDDMKTRIQYMYENSQTTYLEQLLESNSVAEFLNTAEYIAEIQKYDRQKLDEYTENIEYITVAKEQLEQDYADLENMKANVESQKQSVAALMSQKETELAGITSNISDAQEDAKYFEAEIQAQNELIAEIKRIEAEKAAAAAKAAAEGKEVADNPYTGGAFTWPCPSSTRVTSDYGTRVSPTSGASSNHKGIDIGASAGAAIALAAGIILLFIAAFAAYKTADPDPLALPLSLAALYCGTLAGGITASRILGRAAYDAAAVSGAIVSAVMLVVSVFVKEHNIYPLWLKLVMHAGVFAAMLLGALIGRHRRSPASHRTRSSARRRRT